MCGKKFQYFNSTNRTQHADKNWDMNIKNSLVARTDQRCAFLVDWSANKTFNIRQNSNIYRWSIKQMYVRAREEASEFLTHSIRWTLDNIFEHICCLTINSTRKFMLLSREHKQSIQWCNKWAIVADIWFRKRRGYLTIRVFTLTQLTFNVQRTKIRFLMRAMHALLCFLAKEFNLFTKKLLPVNEHLVSHTFLENMKKSR